MATVININISGYGVSQTSKSPDPYRTYRLLPGFFPVRELFGERKIKSNKKQKKNCPNGQVCGFTCISKNKLCRSNMTDVQRKAHDAAKGVLKNASGIQGYSEKEQSSLATKHEQNLYGIAMGRGDARDAETIRRQDEAVAIDNASKEFQSKKIEKLVKMGLTEEEANGLAAWVDHRYEPINQSIYNPNGQDGNSKDFGEGAGVRAYQGMKKLDSYNHEEMVRQAKKYTINEPGVLLRGINIEGDSLKSFIDKYQNAVGKDDFKEPTFLATTTRQNISFLKYANVVYEINAKPDGTGQGKPVDFIKNKSFEGEVVFPPYSRFKVKSVDIDDSGIQAGLKKLPKNDIAQLPEQIQSKINAGTASISEITYIKQMAESSVYYQKIKSADEQNAYFKKFNSQFGSPPLLSPEKTLKTLSSISAKVMIKMEEI